MSLHMLWVIALGAVTMITPCQAADDVEYPDFYTGSTGSNTKGIDFVKSIAVLTPEYCSYVKGDVTIVFKAPGMKYVKAFCWQQPTSDKTSPGGHDVLLAELTLGVDATGSFVFRGDQFPNGPTTIRIQAKDDKNKQDICELQLYNLGGVAWNQGIPKNDPPGAAGMKLVFADDFDGPLSISPNGMNARYSAHKTGGGDFSGWQFADPEGENEPFGQMGTYLRIHASKPLGTKGRSGILSSMRPDGSGVVVSIPSYFECRFVAQSAPGTWPAFWTLTKGTTGLDKTDPNYEAIAKLGCDELDIIEGYGGYGPKNPNSGGVYCSVSHFWSQPKPSWSEKKLPDGSVNPAFAPSSFRTDTMTLGGKSSWSWTLHTYAVAMTETDTVYYFDDIEIGRHPTGPTSKALPAWFLINYAIGGISGWQIDMDRYGNKTDMWVDYVRVYSGCIQMPEISVDGFPGAKPAMATLSSVTEGAPIHYTIDDTEPTENSPLYAGPVAIAKPCTIKAKAFGKGLKPSPTAKLIVSAAPGIPGSIGVNFMCLDSSEQKLAPTEIAGVESVAQANWNNVLGADVPKTLVTSDRSEIPGLSISVESEKNAKPDQGESWGFSGNEYKIQRGLLQPEPAIRATGIPYPKYDVIVYLSAGIHNAKGGVSITKPGNVTGDVDPVGTYYFDFNWQSGKHVQATSTTLASGQAPTGANYVLFTGNTASAFTVQLKRTDSGWWTGISAIQIVPRQ